jgi:hypothetical protein
MIMGVDEELGDIDDQNTSNSRENEPNYTLLYHEFERLVKHRTDENDGMEVEEEGEGENSNILKESKE